MSRSPCSNSSQLKEIESKNDRGLSVVTVRIKDKYDKAAHCRRSGTSSGARSATCRACCRPAPARPIVNDDYGDVWGVFIAIYGEEYSYAELKKYAKLLRRELLLVKDVAKIEILG